VALLALGAQLLAVSCAVGLSVAYVHRALWSSVDSSLQARMVRLLALVGQDEENPSALTFDSDQAQVPQGDIFYIEDAQGKALAGSSAWIGDRRRFRDAGHGWNLRRNGHTYRVAALWTVPILDQEDRSIPQLHATLVYAMPAEPTERQITNATRIAVLVGALELLLSAGLTWWAVGRGMRPLTEFALRADRIEADKAEFEEPSDLVRSAELIPLARALSSLATRVKQAFQRERQFLSDAAHELKTAVAIQKSTLQLLEQEERSKEEYRDGVSRALEDTSRIEHLVRDMLLLSSMEHPRNAGPGAAPEAPLRLRDSLLGAIDQLAPVAMMRSIACVLEANADPYVSGSESDLALAWTNLLENAIQHSAPGARISIELGADDQGSCRVRIVDTGSGIPSVDLPHVFERFYRSDASRSRSTGGFGLGLPIAKAIIDNYGGTIQLWSIPGAGTTVEVRLPRADVHTDVSNAP
jgi:signal transduction histidine kinase